MSIKQEIFYALMALEAETEDKVTRSTLDRITWLVNQLQEPQTPKRAPEDMPEIGQALFARRGDKSRLCVRSGENWLTIIDETGYLFTVDLDGLDEWIPVSPPTFPKEGV